MDDRDAPLERHYRSLFDQAVDGIFFADPTGRYLDVNSAGARMLGYSRDEICSLCIGDVVAREEAARIASHMVELGAGMVLRTDWWFRRKDGSTFFAQVVGQAVGPRLPARHRPRRDGAPASEAALRQQRGTLSRAGQLHAAARLDRKLRNAGDLLQRARRRIRRHCG